MQLPMQMDFNSPTPVELTPAEQSLYGGLDRVRQMTNAGIRRFVNQHRELLQGRVLDYGAGKQGTCRIPQPFRKLIAAKDYVPWEPGDWDLLLEPLSKRYDAILCTQVAQNFEEPLETFKEFHTILKHGGHLVLTYPIAWEPIENEFWRFTPKGIWLLCHKAGLEILSNDVLVQELRDPGGIQPLVGGLVARA